MLSDAIGQLNPAAASTPDGESATTAVPTPGPSVIGQPQTPVVNGVDFATNGRSEDQETPKMADAAQTALGS